MAVGRETLKRILAPVYRGQHASARWPWQGVGERTRLALIAGGVGTVALGITAAVLPQSGNDTSRLLPPVPARISPLPMAPVPRPQPSGPPGFPSAIPTAEASSTPPPAASPTATLPPPASLAVPIKIEAEAASNVLSGAARIRKVAAASGGEVIANIGRAPANSLRFNRIVVPADGVYTLAIHYVSADERTATVSVNDGRFNVLRFPATGDWETVGSLTLRVKLDQGINSLEFSNAATAAPDLDRIIIGA
ncbi:hypothetical protein HC028_18575 [Planosporangium flavigriseum]|uniref:CBM6 domain-containing protein n=1 Tax=Planosporangium flavigriseum TaxID=373681 RepID=A0A8J3LZJ8_9ACTN|nr:hypothetical protein [Planosporangium flavigriseum]NJC66494.1 hypothetical protein [Planosporangium flavigriseum]GIG76371.1 hypothetical protein Pfl04_47750 [Planosporangium flavigriseum]